MYDQDSKGFEMLTRNDRTRTLVAGLSFYLSSSMLWHTAKIDMETVVDGSTRGTRNNKRWMALDGGEGKEKSSSCMREQILSRHQSRRERRQRRRGKYKGSAWWDGHREKSGEGRGGGKWRRW